jgi:hypothetical protein
LSRADTSSTSFNNSKLPQNDYSNLNETETTALLYDETVPVSSFNDHQHFPRRASHYDAHENGLNLKKNSIYILDQDASIIMHQHHFDANKFRSNNQEAPIYATASTQNPLNQYDSYSISNKKLIAGKLNKTYAYCDEISGMGKSPLSPASNRIIRFDDANNKVYDFLPNQSIRQNTNYVIGNGVDMSSPSFRPNEYELSRNRGLNGSYMSNSSNSSYSGGGGGGSGGGAVLDTGGLIHRSNSVGMRASSASSSSYSSSAFLDRKESMRIGLQYLPSSLGYSSIGIKKKRKKLII